jgi:hypothetical protein
MDDFRPAARKQGVSKGGLIEIQGPNGEHQSIPTYTCCHCNRIFRVPENPTDVGFCQKCHHRECIECGTRLNGRCVPFEQKIEAYEQRQKLLAAVGD